MSKKLSKPDLTDKGYEALPTSSNSGEALKTITAYQPDLILLKSSHVLNCDPEIIHQIRLRFEGPVLYLVDKKEEEKLQRARIVGPFCFIKNPSFNTVKRSTIEMALYKHFLNTRLQESEERYQIISEMVSDAAFSLKLDSDKNLVLEWVSNNFYNLIGYGIEDSPKSNGWGKYIHPDDLDLFNQQVETIKSGKAVAGELRLLNKNGQTFWVQFFGQPQKNSRGHIEHIYCALRNITKVKLTREILFRDQEEFRALFDNAPIGMAITSLDYHLRSVNTNLCNLLGYSYREMVSLLSTDITHPDDQKQEIIQFQKLLNSDIPSFVLEKRLVTKNGICLYVMMHASLIRDLHGAPLHFVTQFVDISQQKQNERKLEESYATFATVLDSLDAYVTVIDPETSEILFANQKTTETFGNVDGKICWQALQPGQTAPCAFCCDQQMLLADGRPGRPIIDEDFYTKIQSWVEIRSQAVRWIDNRLVRLEIASDITRRKRMEVEMQLLNGSLSQSLLSMQERNRQMVILSKLSETLQTCHTLFETYSYIEQASQELFYDHPGALSILDPENGVFHQESQWGNGFYSQESACSQNCTCIKEKRTLLSLETENTGICPCIPSNAVKIPFLCAPIMDEGQPFGLLHLEYHDTSPYDYDPLNSLTRVNHSPLLSLKEWADLAMMYSSQLTLSLMNIRLKERLQIEAIRDPLTGLYNRRYMEASLEREFKRANRHHLTVGILIIDIDFFKSYNDQYGHQMGDKILINFGAYLISHFRGEDITCRYGGDEIVVIMPGASLDETLRRANDVNRNTGYLTIENQPFQQNLTTSIGVAVYPNHGSDAKEVMAAADAALYQAKLAGRNRVMAAEPPFSPE